jgi:hypothetical protein
MCEEVLKAKSLDWASLEQTSNKSLEVGTNSHLPGELDNIFSGLNLSQ